MNRRALITGIVGMDGSHLAELLLEKGYEVHGLIRRCSTPTTWRLAAFIDQLHLHDGDLLDSGSLTRIVRTVRPHEVYNLAAQSFVAASFDEPDHTGNVTGLGTVRLLEALRQGGGDARFYQASSSEMFGSAAPPQSEQTPFHPRSPYGVAKLYAHFSTLNYREAYGFHASNGILFNHESERRSEHFVTRKITMAVARIHAGLQKKLVLGNINARRDWGYAPDYVDAMWRMLQRETPDDYVIATGATHSIRDFLAAAFGAVDLKWEPFVVTDPTFYRPAEVDVLQGDASKACNVLGWIPTVSFNELVKRMVRADIDRLRA